MFGTEIQKEKKETEENYKILFNRSAENDLKNKVNFFHLLFITKKNFNKIILGHLIKLYEKKVWKLRNSH